MAHSVAPQARDDLRAIWWHIATESGSAAIARRQLTAITNRFRLLERYPELGRARDDDLGRAGAAIPFAPTSSSTG
jgi:plasmid stabilization system protein ParE